MSKRNKKISGRKMGMIADRLQMTVDALREMFAQQSNSRHRRFTRKTIDDRTERNRRRIRKSIWKKQRGYK